MCLREKLQHGPYCVSDADSLNLDRELIYVVPDTNIFLHNFEAIHDLLLRGNVLKKTIFVCSFTYLFLFRHFPDHLVIVFIAEEVRREIDKMKKYNQTAQQCSKQICEKLCDRSVKMQGQTLASYNVYAPEKVEGDLNILFCCMQLEPHVNKVILLTSDFGFRTLATINGVTHCTVATMKRRFT